MSTRRVPKAVREHMAKMGKRGAKARHAALTPEQRVEIARAGGKAKAAKMAENAKAGT